MNNYIENFIKNVSLDEALILIKDYLNVYFSKNELENVLHELAHHETYGTILRAKGMLKGENEWFYFDLVPEEVEIRIGKPCYTGRFVVIGSNLDEEALKKCFYAA